MSNQNVSFNIPFSQTRTFAEQGGLKDKVVLITGSASGFGRVLALELAGFGSKLILCDVSSKGLDSVNQEIAMMGGEVVSKVCDVTSWEEQLAVFEAGFKRFGQIDIVVANAGISEMSDKSNSPDVFPIHEQDFSVSPPKPSLKVIDINLNGVFYTMRLAFHFLRKGPRRSGRAIIAIGSMASFTSIPTAPLYSASKSGVLGLVKSASDLSQTFLKEEKIRISMIAPFFALTNLIPPYLRKALEALPLASVEDVVGSIIHSMAPLDSKSKIMDGQVYTVPDSKGAFVLPSKVSQLVIYDELKERTKVTAEKTGRVIAQLQKDLGRDKGKL